MKEKAKQQRQHYVPKFYLKLFSTEKNGTFVYCYDKKTNGARKVSVKRLCSEIGFYESPNKPNKPIEDAFSIQESQCGNLLRKVINAADLRALTLIEFAEFLNFLVILKQRTKKRRDIVSQARKIWLENKNSQLTDWRIVPTSDNWQQADHLLSIPALYEEESKQLFKNDWQLVVNKTKVPFWTSDDPLRQGIVKNDTRFKEPYIKNYFPLTPSLLVHSQPLIGDYVSVTKAFVKDENAVNFVNRLAWDNAQRFVISKENNFHVHSMP